MLACNNTSTLLVASWPVIWLSADDGADSGLDCGASW